MYARNALRLLLILLAGTFAASIVLIVLALRGPASLSRAADDSPDTGTWVERASMSTPRNDHASAVVNNEIYAIGGWGWSGGGVRSTCVG